MACSVDVAAPAGCHVPHPVGVVVRENRAPRTVELRTLTLRRLVIAAPHLEVELVPSVPERATSDTTLPPSLKDGCGL
jgi:hypothetical protein